MTSEEAIALSKTEFWKHLTHKEIAAFQMKEEKLCMPFDVFHEAVTKALGRPVWTHELALDREGIMAELLDGKPAPTFDEIMQLIPADKRIVIALGHPTQGA